MFDGLLAAERKRNVRDVPMIYSELATVSRSVFGMKCAISQVKHQMIEAVRWDPKQPARVDNIVLMTPENARKHEAITDLSAAPYDTATVQRVKALLARSKELCTI